MLKCVGFTICAKNYLAQAFVLKESFKKWNPDKDFFIFLSDDIDDTVKRYNEVIQLSTDFIPRFEEMAFKYKVVEFSTSIKPFCINKLFNDGYEKVIYLDPDIFVTDSLNSIYAMLDKKDILLTSHYNHLYLGRDGVVPEHTILRVGIFNLGFCAFRETIISKQIISWWMNKLADWCYDDGKMGVFVDQKWITILPGIHYEKIGVLDDPGCNVAIWNLHERELIVDNKRYFIKDTVNDMKSSLKFYHFSGFDPYTEEYINRRHPEFNTSNFPSFKPIIDEYRTLEYENGYDYYSKLTYSFSCFNDGTVILPINRGLYREIADKYPHPFSNKELITFFADLKLLSKKKDTYTDKYQGNDKESNGQKIILLFRLILKLLGADKFNAFLGALQTISSYHHQTYLYKDVSWKDLYE